MNLEALKATVTSKAARQLLLGRKYSPQILFATGTVGVVGTVVLACRATLKVSDALEQHEANMDRLTRLQNNESYGKDNDVLDIDKEKGRLKIKTAITIAKPYLPAVGLGIVSIGALTGSHVILTKRNTAVMAAYAGLDRAFKQYRQRVANEYGEDTDRKFSAGYEVVQVQEKQADSSVKTTDKVSERPFNRSPYAALFDDKSKHWTKEPGMNEHILTMKMSHANDKLKAQGHLFLNEVFDMLDLPRTKAGAVVGWVYRRDNEEQYGDNYVSFGLFDNEPEQVDLFLDGREPSVWLDFNVAGMIYDLI